MWCYEIAIGEPKNRNKLILPENVEAFIKLHGKTQQLYLSTYMYDVEEAKKIIEQGKSVSRSYEVERAIEYIPIDIDKGQNSDEFTHKKVIRFINTLEGLGLTENMFQVYFSGTGYHIWLTNQLFGFQPSKDLHLIVSETMKGFDSLGSDVSIYRSSSIIRCSNSINLKTDLYKIPLTKDEVIVLTPQDIKERAKQQRFDFPVSKLESPTPLFSKFIVMPTKEDTGNIRFSKKVETTNVAMCINRMIQEGANEGNRNNQILRIATHLRRNNVPEDFTIAGLVNQWNTVNGMGLDPKDIAIKVKQTYRSPYNYGCNDPLLAKYCSPQCIFYKNKNYSMEVLNTENLMNSLEDSINVDNTGKTLLLSKMFNVDLDIDAMPGELVTILGATGTNKTFLALHFALGIDFVTGEVNPEYQLPCLFVELELTEQNVARRMIQIACNVSKEEVYRNFTAYKERAKELIANISFTRKIKSIETLRLEILKSKPKLVVIDYLDCFKSGKWSGNEYEDKNITTHALSDLAVELNVVILLVSQVGRADAKDKNVNIYSGKGSGSIENASRKVITINGEQASPYRKIKIEKNNDGDTTGERFIMLELSSSMRMTKMFNG